MDISLQLDHIDHAILKRLQTHAKLTNVQLAEEIGLSPASTLERVRKLEHKGVITHYYTQLAAEKLGLTAQLFIQIKLEQTTAHNVTAFKEAIAHLPEITACYQVLGDADFLIKVVVADLPAYQQFVQHKLSQIATIQSLKPLVITDTTKDAGISIA